MDNETYGFIGLGVGLLLGGEIAWIATMIAGDRKAKKAAPILDREYGPRIKGNLAKLEAAVQAGDRQAAFNALKERDDLLGEIEQLSFRYLAYSERSIGGPVVGCACDEVKNAMRKSYGLENYLRAGK